MCSCGRYGLSHFIGWSSQLMPGIGMAGMACRLIGWERSAESIIPGQAMIFQPLPLLPSLLHAPQTLQDLGAMIT